VENVRKPMLWEEDALNLLAIKPDKRHNREITPQPGEAARLLGRSVEEIESDRLLSAQRLENRYVREDVIKGERTKIA
ncbi:NAD(P)H-hydrate dehydratase, partial [Salmonella enterica]|uniref:NAD(P)H-hydrate dehydratase n=1 Tax=Salmonella enterica TaxID=28901 RepID=UPI0007972576